MQVDRAAMFLLEYRCTATMIEMSVGAKYSLRNERKLLQAQSNVLTTEARINEHASARRGLQDITVRRKNASGDPPQAIAAFDPHGGVGHVNEPRPGRWSAP